MKVLFIGGTGFISTAVSRMAIERGMELYLLNRGNRLSEIPGAHQLTGDIHHPESMRNALKDHQFDVVVDWIAFTPEDVERDLQVFRGRTKQFVFISSASAYQKPVVNYVITESTPLKNPYWEYSRNKIASEELLLKAYRDEDFPVTIVRPSYTYNTYLPVAIGGFGCYTLADRMLKGKPIIVHGDGTSLWVNTHAEDFAKGFLGLLGNEKAIGQAFHITSDEVLTWNQIYQTIADVLGVEAKMIHIPTDFIIKEVPRLTGDLLGDKTWSAVFDNSKIKAFVPDFQATIPFREGMRRALGWFAADKNRQRINEQVNAEMDQIINAYTGNPVK
ncbi:MAG: NAD-dependent dehydratase [Bacteroidetes bacterium GWB2_41_8]|nr:MAG: NAD-dependent dehydratase [Bacteroidetes bacterium GWB2_41_8]